jgi:membrane protein DedA with SNARE-associated domain/membrane-associated phospholipid phosphatase
MDPGSLEALLAWVAANPLAAGALIFAVALLDGLVVVGLVMPSAAVLIALGTLVGLGALNGPYAMACAALGAACGDLISYAFGRRSGARMTTMWPFAQHPGWLARSESLFRRHDIKGVVLGRWIGATRPFIPAIAGMLRMPLRRYLPACLFACATWAPMYLLPGWLLGASLDILLAVAGRLVLVLTLAIGLLAGSYFAVAQAYRRLAPRASSLLEAAMAWSIRHPRLGRISAALIDPRRPESASLLVLALWLLLAGWAFFALLLFAAGGEALAVDLWLREQLVDLRTPWADPLMLLLAAPGEPVVLLPAATGVFLWLLWRRRHVAAWHWVGAVAFGIALVELLGHSLAVAQPPGALAVQGFSFPSEPVALATVTYGFFAVLIARELPGRDRAWPYGVAAVLVAAVGAARLYFGAHWLSDVLAGAALGTLWITALGIAYRRRSARSFWMRPLASGFFIVVGALSVWQATRAPQAQLAAFALPELRTTQSAGAWWNTGWRELPARRNDLGAGRDWPFNLQAALPGHLLEARLLDAGWRREDQPAWQGLLRRLDGGVDAGSLPVLPASHNGRRDDLLFSRALAGSDVRLALRLWRAPVDLDPDAQPLWLGSVAELHFERWHGLVARWRVEPASPLALETLAADLDGLALRRVLRDEPGAAVLLVASTESP